MRGHEEHQQEAEIQSLVRAFNENVNKLLFVSQADKLEIQARVVKEQATVVYSTVRTDRLAERLKLYNALLQNVHLMTSAKISMTKTSMFVSKIQDDQLSAQSKVEFREAYFVCADEFKAMAEHLLTASTYEVPKKDLKLLADAARNTNNFYSSLLDSDSKNKLVDSIRQMNKKMSPFWHKLTTALLGFLGAGCILIGALGLLPSFGASVAFIAVGSVLSLSSLPRMMLNTYGSKTRKLSMAATAAMESMQLIEKNMKFVANAEFDKDRVSALQMTSMSNEHDIDANDHKSDESAVLADSSLRRSPKI
jgi:hypothetical protein